MPVKIRKKQRRAALSASEYIDLFKSFKVSQRLEIARQINLMTFRQEWKKLSPQMPDARISEEEIMQEVKAVRYGKG